MLESVAITDRRRFLKTALQAGAVLAAPYVIPSTALGKDGATPPATASAWGSSGWAGKAAAISSAAAGPTCPAAIWAATTCRCWPSATSSASGRTKARPASNRHYAEKFGQGSYQGCGAYWDIRDMLVRDDIDAVLIAAAYHAAATNTLVAAPGGQRRLLRKADERDDPRRPGRRRGRARRYGRVYQGGTQQRLGIRRPIPPGRRIGPRRRGSAGCSGSTPTRLGGGVRPPPRPPASGAVPPDVNWEAYVDRLPWFNYDGRHRRPSLRLRRHQLGPAPLRHRAMGRRRRRHRPGRNPPGSGQAGLPLCQRRRGLSAARRPAQAWDEGGACFVGTEGKITVHRDKFFSDPPEIVKETPGMSHTRRLLFDEPLGQLPGVRPHAAADHLRRGDRAPRVQHAPAGRNRHAHRPAR